MRTFTARNVITLMKSCQPTGKASLQVGQNACDVVHTSFFVLVSFSSPVVLFFICSVGFLGALGQRAWCISVDCSRMRRLLLWTLAVVNAVHVFALPSKPAGHASRQHLVANIRRNGIKTAPALRINNGTQHTIFDPTAAVSQYRERFYAGHSDDLS